MPAVHKRENKPECHSVVSSLIEVGQVFYTHSPQYTAHPLHTVSLHTASKKSEDLFEVSLACLGKRSPRCARSRTPCVHLGYDCLSECETSPGCGADRNRSHCYLWLMKKYHHHLQVEDNCVRLRTCCLKMFTCSSCFKNTLLKTTSCQCPSSNETMESFVWGLVESVQLYWKHFCCHLVSVLFQCLKEYFWLSRSCSSEILMLEI